MCTRGTYPILPGKRLGSLFLYNTTVSTVTSSTTVPGSVLSSTRLLPGTTVTTVITTVVITVITTVTAIPTRGRLLLLRGTVEQFEFIIE